MFAILATTRVATSQPVPDPGPPPANPGPPAANPAPPSVPKPPPPNPYPDPLPPQEPVVEPQPPPQPQGFLLTPDEVALLQRGEIDGDKRLYGIVANAVVGYGLGQALQGRWKDTGWKFTLGQGAGTVLFFAAAGRDSVGFELTAAACLITFYIWGIVDAAIGPERHNDRIRDIKLRNGIPITARLSPYVQRSHESGTAGLSLRF